MSIDVTGFRGLADTQWLAAHLKAPELRVLECTSELPNYFEPSAADGLTMESGRPAWTAEHIPGAAFADLLNELSDRSRENFMYAMPTAEQFAAVMSRLGVGDGTAVVLYDRRMNQWAARVWWMLRAFGFDNAAVLNGGWAQWVAESHPVSREVTEPPRAQFVARPRPALIASRADVEKAIDDPGTCLVNALDPDEFAGRPPQRYARPGRIPNSVNVPFARAVDVDSQIYADDETLRQRFRAIGALDKEQVICYCGGAIAASSTALLLTRLGVDNVRLYDGSLTEWSADPSLPMETG